MATRLGPWRPSPSVRSQLLHRLLVLALAVGASLSSRGAFAASPRTALDAGRGAKERYLREFVHFYDEPFSADLGDLSMVNSASSRRPFQGLHKRKLSWREFYALVGRTDWLSRMRQRRVMKAWFMVGGGLGAGSAFLTFLALTRRFDNPCESNLPDAQSRCRAYWTGNSALGATFLASSTLWFLGWVLPDNPTSRRENLEAAADYNRRLRKQLGLDPDAAVRPRGVQAPQGPEIRLSFSLDPKRSVLGLRVQGRF